MVTVTAWKTVKFTFCVKLTLLSDPTTNLQSACILLTIIKNVVCLVVTIHALYSLICWSRIFPYLKNFTIAVVISFSWRWVHRTWTTSFTVWVYPVILLNVIPAVCHPLAWWAHSYFSPLCTCILFWPVLLNSKTMVNCGYSWTRVFSANWVSTTKPISIFILEIYSH